MDMKCSVRRVLRSPWCIGVLWIACGAFLSARAGAQESAVVAVDDSPTAQQLLAQAEDHAINNPAEAARLVSRVLDEFGRKLVRSGSQADVFVDGRQAAEHFLRTHPRVLERFRSSQTGEAERLARAGDDRVLLETRLLTAPGIQCAIRETQRAIERAHFEQAQDLLNSIADHPDRDALDPTIHSALMAMAAWGRGDAASVLRVINELKTSSDPALRTLSDALAQATSTPIATSREVANPLAPAQFGAIPTDPVLLWSEPLEQSLDSRLMQSIEEGLVSAAGSEGASSSGRLLVSIPTVDGALVLVNEGYVLRAYEAYSHLPRWYQLLGAPNAPRSDLLAGDLEAVVVAGDRVLALSGHALGSQRSGGGRLMCLDLLTGRRMWEVTPDRFSEQSEFRDLFLYGAPTVVGNTVVLLCRKVTARLETVSSVIGVNLDTGVIEWMTPVGAAPGIRSAGTRPYTSPVVDKSTVFVSTGAGTTASIDAIDGRINWIRRDAVPIRDVQLELMPWEMGGAIVTSRGVITLAPGGAHAQLLSIDDGSELDAIPVGAGTAWGVARYLLTDASRTLIFAVGEGIHAFRVSDLRTPIWKFTGVAGDDSIASLVGRAGMRGRVQVGSTSDGRVALIVPLLSRALLLAGDDGSVVSTIPCEGPANIVARDGIIAAATNSSLEVFMDSRRAREILIDAVESQASDVDATLGLIAFALQSQDAGLLRKATALAHLKLDNVRDEGDRRARLVDLLVRAATSGLLGRDESDTLFEAIITALEDSSERAAVLLAQGDWFSRSDRVVRAIASWRAVLKNEAVANATLSQFTTGSIDLRQSGSDAALQRLEAIAHSSRAPAQAFESEAIPPTGATASQLEAFSAQNPCTNSAARAWMTACGLRMSARENALGAGDAAAAVNTAISTGDDDLIAEILDRAVTLMSQSDLEITAAQLCDAAVIAGANVKLASHRGITAAQFLEASPAAGLVAGRSRWGSTQGASPESASLVAQRLPGVLAPVRDVGASLDFRSRAYLVADGHLRCVSTPTLAPRWATQLLGEMPFVIPMRDGVILIEQRDREKLAAQWIDDGGERRWMLDDLAGAVPGGGGLAQRSECMVLGGREYMVVARPDGALAAFGVGDGLPRWLAQHSLDEIVCADAGETIVVVSGTRSSADSRTSWLVALDIRTGLVIAELPAPSDEPVRWVQVHGAGEVAFGTTRGVGRWQIVGAAVGMRWHAINARLRGSVRCDALGFNLVVADATDRTTILNWQTGSIDDAKFVPTKPRPIAEGPRRWFRVGECIVAWTSGGVDLFSLHGEAIGSSGLHGTRRIHTVSPCASVIVAVEQPDRTEPRDVGLARVASQLLIHRLGWGDGGRIAGPALELDLEFTDNRIERMQIVDGWLLLSGSQSTLAIPVPHGG